MKRKTGKRVLVMLMALAMVLSFSMTAFASGSTHKTQNKIYGSLTTGTKQGNGVTTNQNGGSAYVGVRVQYVLTSGNFAWSSLAEKSGSASVSVTKTATGAVHHAESLHGTGANNIEFTLYL